MLDEHLLYIEVMFYKEHCMDRCSIVFVYTIFLWHEYSMN